jgi:hypothetical protein
MAVNPPQTVFRMRQSHWEHRHLADSNLLHPVFAVKPLCPHRRRQHSAFALPPAPSAGEGTCNLQRLNFLPQAFCGYAAHFAFVNPCLCRPLSVASQKTQPNLC